MGPSKTNFSRPGRPSLRPRPRSRRRQSRRRNTAGALRGRREACSSSGVAVRAIRARLEAAVEPVLVGLAALLVVSSNRDAAADVEADELAGGVLEEGLPGRVGLLAEDAGASERTLTVFFQSAYLAELFASTYVTRSESSFSVQLPTSFVGTFQGRAVASIASSVECRWPCRCRRRPSRPSWASRRPSWTRRSWWPRRRTCPARWWKSNPQRRPSR